MCVATLFAIAANPPAHFIGAGILLLFLYILVLKKKLTGIYYLFIIFYLICYYHAEDLLQLSSIDTILTKTEYITSGVEGQLTGRVVRIIEKDGYYQVIVTNCSVTVNEQTADDLCVLLQMNQISVSDSEQNDTNDYISTSIVPGDRIRVEGKIKAFAAARNEGEFDGWSYYHSIGVDYKMTSRSVERLEVSRDKLTLALESLRSRIAYVYSQIANTKDAGIYDSIVLGDKSSLEDETKELYQSAGIAHILAISGLHIALLGMTLYKILRRLGLTFLPAGFISVFIMICYGIMTGSGISSTRAIVMFLLSIVAEILGRTYDIRTATAVAGMILLYSNPYILYNSGFQLSFGAICGITFLVPPLKVLLYVDRIKPKWLQYLISTVIVSLSINLMTFPIILYQYFQFPTYSVLLNLIVIPFMSIVMICCILAGLLGMLSTVAGSFFIGGAHYILLFYDWLCNLFLKLPGSVIVLGRPTLIHIILYYIFLSLLIGMFTKPVHKHAKRFLQSTQIQLSSRIRWNRCKRILSSLLLLCAITCISWNGVHRLFQQIAGDSILTVKMIDVGQGDSIFIQTQEGVNYLFDGGSSDIKNVGKNRILKVLKANAVICLDYIVISHCDSDHISGVIELMNLMDQTFCIRNIVLPKIYNPDDAYQNIVGLAAQRNIEVLYVNTGSQIGTDSTSIKCIHPSEDYVYASTNDYSANYLIQYKEFDLLMTGDIEKEGEQSVLNKNLYQTIDLLKVAHHGSSSSTTDAFLNAVSPRLAFISCGINNSYGHPSPSTLEKLESTGIQYMITAQMGEITIRTDGEHAKIDCISK